MAFAWHVLIVLLASEFTRAVLVTTPSGPLLGTNGTSRDGRTYHRFHGIPYAEPPVGALRLKNPVPIEPWTAVRNSKETPRCIQVSALRVGDKGEVLGEDDCLYLNIFTPKLVPEKLLAVLFHVHYGSYQEGKALTGHAADYLMDEDVVFVTVDYRVGIMGFLSLEDEIIPGNFGLKDLALAISWVKTNIASFGGDPDRITVVGESAGAMLTNFLMKSPLSKNLIKGGISESGVADKPFFAAKNSAKERALKVAEMVGCSGTSQEILDCLQNKPGNTIVETHKNFTIWDISPLSPFKPVAEPNKPGAFLTEDPRNIISELPWITGTTTDEILITGSLAAQNESLVDEFIKNIDDLLPEVLCVDTIDDAAKESLKLIKQKYFPKLDRDSVLKGLKEVNAYGLFIAPMLRAVEKHKGPKYVYKYDYRGANAGAEMFGKQSKYIGIGHAEEIILLYNTTDLYPKVTEADTKVSKNLVKMWANFAKDGIPSSDWKEWKNGEYLLIQETNSMKKFHDREIVDFWLNLPLYK